MKSFYFTGILIVFVLVLDFAKGIQNSPEEIKFLCRIFPEILQEKCDEYNDNEFQNKIKFTINGELKISAIKETNWMECKVCKLVIKFVIKEIGSNRTEEAIRKALAKVCDHIPYKKQCTAFVDKYTSEIIKYILDNIPVDEICKKIGVCKKIEGKFENETNWMECKVCKLVIKFVIKEIGSNRTEEAIRKALAKVCDHIPYKKQCTAFVDKYTSEIIKYILDNIPVDEICKKIGVCKKIEGKFENESVLKSNSLLDDPGNKCESCKVLVKNYEDNINDDLPILELQQTLITVCDLYNKNLREQCYSFFYGPGLEVITDIILKEDPTKVCQLMHLCLKEKENQYMIFTDIMTSLNSLLNLKNCTRCTNIITWYEKNLDLSKKPEDIRHILLQYCEIFKCPYHDQCVKYFTGIGYEVLKYILNKADPETICKHFHFCQSRNIWSTPLKLEE